jgi:hypothetical protein
VLDAVSRRAAIFKALPDAAKRMATTLGFTDNHVHAGITGICRGQDQAPPDVALNRVPNAL